MDKRSIDEKNVDVIVAREQAKKQAKNKGNVVSNKDSAEVQKLLKEFEEVHGEKFGENIGKKNGGMVTSEYRGGGAVNLGNYKGQF